MQRSAILAIGSLLVAVGQSVGCAVETEEDRLEVDPAASTAAIPLPQLRSCPSGYVPPGLWPPIDPVALLNGAASDCAVGSNASPCAPHHVYTPSPVRERE